MRGPRRPGGWQRGGPQRVALQISALRSICLRHPHVADQHAVEKGAEVTHGAQLQRKAQAIVVAATAHDLPAVVVAEMKAARRQGDGFMQRTGYYPANALPARRARWDAAQGWG